MNRAKVFDIKEKQYSNMLDDIYLYLYNNYKDVATQEGYEPVTLPTFLEQLWDNIDRKKARKKMNIV